MNHEYSNLQEVEFEEILADFTTRVRDNEHPDIEEYTGRFPDHREQIEALFPVVACLESTRKNVQEEADAARWKLPRLERLGEYDLLREIGRGGMGVVYEARQASLDRRVALKVLPPGRALSPKSLARFQREARMSARLHHSSIVPILGTGQAGATYFIAMQLIDGVGLDKIINVLVRRNEGADASSSSFPPDIRSAPNTMSTPDDSSAPSSAPDAAEPDNAEVSIAGIIFPVDAPPETRWRAIAGIGCQAASALTHSHTHHVVHRDIKPSNLIIDRQGKTWVADFGLARSFDGITDDDMTRDVGTPRYMAPEQALGATTRLSDIYSLGLTLYELASQKPVFQEGSDDDLTDFRKRKQEPLPALGERVDGVPRDLERILMKCIAVEPENRYRSAGALAEDFERFLDNRPLANVRTPLLARGKRWAQRNPQTAVATALAALFLTGIAIVSLFSYWKVRAQLETIESTLQVSMETLDKVYDRLSPVSDSLAGQTSGVSVGRQRPFLSDPSARLLNELLSSYDRLARLDSTNREIRLAAAKANFRVGEIHRQLGNTREAEVALKRSIELHRKLVTGKVVPQNEVALPVVRALISLSTVRSDFGHLDHRYLREALTVIGKATTPAGNLSEENRLNLRYEKARALLMLGVVPRRRPTDFSAGSDERSVATASSREYLSRAIEILEQWSPPYPARITDLLAVGYGERATRFGDEDFRRAIDLQEKLVDEFPDVQRFRTNLARLYAEIDPLVLEIDEYPEAVRRIRQAIRTSAPLDFNNRRTRTIVKHAHHKLALIFARVARESDRIAAPDMERILGNHSRNALDEAVKHIRQALEIQALRPGGGGQPHNADSYEKLSWTLRFRITQCQLLWERNRGNDRDEVAEIIERSISEVGAIASTTERGARLKGILDQLIATGTGSQN